MELPALPTSVTVFPGLGGLDRIRIETPRCSGEIYRHGATVTSWRPAAASEDVLFLSPASKFEAGAAIRGGVPICGPWFGPGRSGDRAPIHGFLRLAPWKLVGARDEDGTVTLDLRLTGAEYAALPAAAGWPTDAVFTYSVVMGDDLSLTVGATAGEDVLELEWALHTYLSVGEVRRIRIDGLDGASYVDKTDGGQVKPQTGAVAFTGETDRVYDSPGPVVLTDPADKRNLEVSSSGAAQTVLWNPFPDKASGMADVGGTWPRFVCVEAASVLDRHESLDPGASTRLTQRIRVA